MRQASGCKVAGLQFAIANKSQRHTPPQQLQQQRRAHNMAAHAHL